MDVVDENNGDSPAAPDRLTSRWTDQGAVQ